MIFFPQTSSIRAFSKTASLYSILAQWGQWTYHRKISLSWFFLLVVHTTFISAYNSTLPVHMLCKAIENLKSQARKDPLDMWKLHFILLSNCKEQATITKLMNFNVHHLVNLTTRMSCFLSHAKHDNRIKHNSWKPYRVHVE